MADSEEGYVLRHSRPVVSIQIVWEKPFYGTQANQLMQLMKETKSIRQACSEMGMSYSKGRAIIAQMEQQLGYPVVQSQQGGKSGGHSALTQEGEQLVNRYSAFSAEVTQQVDALFKRYFLEAS